jgi:aminoglycoside phosphotransferase (APT) family kinase protein
MTAQPASLGVPSAEIAVDADLVRRLISAQHPDFAGLPIRPAFSGWDNEMFRLGDELAVRLPRRAVAAGLILIEQYWLPKLPPLPLPIPVPIRTGAPGEGYPWAWSILPYLPGEPADLAPPLASEGQALGAFFHALHVPAPSDAPRNAYRGVPMIQRQTVIEERLERIAAATDLVTPRIRRLWAEALETPMEGETWLQGDPHAKNVLTDAGRFSAVIDWGDMCVGDPACDLAAVWMLLPDPSSRDDALAAYGEVSDTFLRRARGWAVMYGAMLLDAGLVNDPRLARMGKVTMERLEVGP